MLRPAIMVSRLTAIAISNTDMITRSGNFIDNLIARNGSSKLSGFQRGISSKRVWS